MTWVRFDDQFPIHRKVAGLSDVLYRLHTEAIFWCARNTTDGVIHREDLATIGRRATAERADELVRRKLWHLAGQLCTRCSAALAEAGAAEPVEGWVVHEYLAFQPSRSKIEKERDQKAERQRRWLEKKSGGRESRPSTRPSVDASRDSVIDGNPAPPRPEGSGAKPRGASRPLASQGGGRRADENPDWRTLPDLGTHDPDRADRTRRGAAAARAALAGPITEEAS
jgi:hypothetical protein